MYGTIRFFIKANDTMYIVFRRFKVIHTEICTHQKLRKRVKHILPVEADNRNIMLDLINIKLIN